MKNNAPKSGFFSTRFLLAWTLCSVGVLLGLVSLPAPGGQRGVTRDSSKATPTQIGATSTSMPCPGPAICGQTCSLDPFGTPIYCSNGQCECAPGYDLQNGVCQPIQPEVIGSENVKLVGGYDCPGICPQAQTTTWAFVGSIYNAFDLVPVHGTAPGGEAFMPVWGYQASQCGDHGVARGASCQGGSNNSKTCGSNADCPGGTCAPLQTWAGCAPDPFPFCYGIQGANPDGFNFNSCSTSDGQGTCGIDPFSCDPITGDNCKRYCEEGQNEYLPHHSIAADPRSSVGLCDLCGGSTSLFTSASPYLGESFVCNFHINGFDNPARIDFPNNVIVYRAPIRWEDFMNNILTIIDDDWTWDMQSQGHELFDTDTEYLYHSGCSDETHGRIHVEFSSGEVTDNFTDDNWGAANEFWQGLRCAVDSNYCQIGPQGDNEGSCYLRSFVNPGLTCPPSEQVDQDCNLHDPMAVVVGVPSMDCADDPYQGTDEIHPILAMAIRTQEDPSKGPEKWAFFYRQHGSEGPCGNSTYSRCLSDFKLPLGLPVVPGNAVLTGADVHVEWHKWADETFGSGSADISVCGSTSDSSGAGSINCANSFDLINGTVLNIHLPHNEDGVVGLVTVTPHYDTTPPTITCPANITKPADPGKCTAAVTFAPMASDNCAVNSVVCNTPSGSAFPVGTTTDTCTATDQAGQTASCSFNVTVVDNQPPMISNMSVSPTTLSPPNHKIVDVAVNYTASDNCGAVTCTLSGTSNEPDNGMGDGDTPNDIIPIDSHNIGLRAERSGRGNGRLYTITTACTDAHANSTTAAATVSVPKGGK
jgi:HYR domain-containing protein